MPNLYWTLLYCDFAICPTPYYHKWALIRRLILVYSVIIEHNFTSNFIVVVNSVSIFADVIFINLRLLFLMYQFPIHGMFYWENNTISFHKWNPVKYLDPHLRVILIVRLLLCFYRPWYIQCLDRTLWVLLSILLLYHY